MNLTDFTVAELTAAINQFPVQWGRVSQLGLFRDRGIRTREIVIEDRSGTLAVLNTHEWGGNGTVASAITRNTYAFGIKQTVHDDLVAPSDVVGVRAFGQDQGIAGLQGMSDEIALRLQRIRARHDATLEYKRMGALKGIVYNADGTSVLANMFTTFGVQQVDVDFALGTSTTDILAKCFEVRNTIEDNLKGDTVGGIRVLVSPDFFQKFIKHSKVTAAYTYTNEQINRQANDMRKGFTFGGITFEEYRGSINGTALIASGEGHAFPEGTSDTFATYFAPADFNEAVNTVGLPIYVKTYEKEAGRGMVIHTQCNSLPLCHQPKVLVKVRTSN